MAMPISASVEKASSYANPVFSTAQQTRASAAMNGADPQRPHRAARRQNDTTRRLELAFHWQMQNVLGG